MFYFLRAESYKSQPMFGRHGAHKHHDSMAEVILILIIVIYNTCTLLLIIVYRLYKVKAMLHLLSSSTTMTLICEYFNYYFNIIKFFN